MGSPRSQKNELHRTSLPVVQSSAALQIRALLSRLRYLQTLTGPRRQRPGDRNHVLVGELFHAMHVEMRQNGITRHRFA